ncbi:MULTISPECIES: hypothetical protein [unclassified Leisingera]|uniref:hypothetical protein n=1 Tax=unclassified Leisingera TaxID=2614906 RepID=UPI001012CBF6|nr:MULTISPECIES: hypothetical protein [unclassified Leisingera]MCF6430632.1 hypothetical protein [Leisingera sp. MMG026]QAX32151.1 hypothetical protein ETW24_22460 [Leisingera sp. NJS204]
MTNHRTFVVSCGASGSKVFSRFLYPGEDTRQAARRHLHNRNPQEAPVQAARFVYLFSDPRDSVISFFQRRLTKHSNHGFASQDGPRQEWEVAERDWVLRHLRNLGGNGDAVSGDWGLEEYLEYSREDVFRMEEHFCNWLAATTREVLFVRYETLWQHEQDVIRHLGLPADSRLPEFVPRAADWQSQPPAVRDRLNRLYGGFAGRLAALPGLFDGSSPEAAAVRQAWAAAS